MDDKVKELPVIGGYLPARVELEAGQRYAWCSCGKSQNQPFCDGSHKGGAFVPLAWVPEHSTQAALCTCKRTGNPPFCDGTHKSLGPAPSN